MSKEKKDPIVSIDAVSNTFRKYAEDIDKNTVKTGIKSIDDNIRLQTCSHVTIAACAGSGKTSLVLNILNNLSQSGSKSLFGSFDMNSNLIYQKLAQRVSGLDDNKLYDIYKNKRQAEITEIDNRIASEYKNTLFDFRSGNNFEEVRETLLRQKEKQGNDLKLVVYDYISRVRGPYDNETANMSYVAPRMSDLANETETLIISLAQIPRSAGGPNTPILSSRVAKGSSAIEESASVFFGLWRPGYNKGVDDKYMCISAVKTRMGREFTTSLHFDGLTSTIRDMTNDEQKQYDHFIDKMEEEKEMSKHKSDDSGW